MRVCLVVVAALLCVAGCSSDTDDGIRPLTDADLNAAVADTATTSSTAASQAPATTAASTQPPATEPLDEWAIPDNPDAAYFERVINELGRISAKGGRIVLENGGPTPEFEANTKSITDGKSLAYGIDFWRTLDPESETLELLTLDESVRATETEVLELTGDCAVIRALMTFDGVYRLPRDPSETTHLLRRAEPDGENLTGWKWHDSTVTGSTSFTCAA